MIVMKILEVYANFLPRVGGVERHIYGLCKCLIHRGHNPIVLTWGPSAPSFEIIEGIRIHRFWMPRLFYLTRYPQFLYLFLRTIYVVKKYNVDIIQAHDYPAGVPTALAGGLLRKPVVVTFHLPMWFWPNLVLPTYVCTIEPILKKCFLNFVAAVICNSKFTRREILKLGLSPSKVKVIYNWVASLPRCNMNHLSGVLKKFGLNEKNFILSVGRLDDRHKGFSMLIQALGLLKNKGYDLTLAIAGKGRDKQLLMDYSIELGIKHHVRFLDSVSDTDLACLYEGCELFVLPSRLEGFGLVLLEAMSFGKPIVSTKVGGIPEVIENGINGILVDPEPSALASGIEMLLSSPHLKKGFAERSREIVSEKFSLKNCYATIDFLEAASRIREM